MCWTSLLGKDTFLQKMVKLCSMYLALKEDNVWLWGNNLIFAQILWKKICLNQMESYFFYEPTVEDFLHLGESVRMEWEK